ncbi:MAG: HPt (histidine-containing phosphotransfer) domain-containing protein [Paracoccaceae bacterium]|jgi:HPt (histidine-containing phosphotransfer) domain-containing protein
MIDWDRVDELRREVGDEDFSEIVALFLDEVAEVADRLRSAQPSETLVEDFHFLKGCALNLGFFTLAGLCQKGETSGASRSEIEQLLLCYDRSLGAFSGWSKRLVDA